ncbi:unnamed protein product [Cylindrotheca closterium]|uniref:Uncharacterized protein n=1 Tax=Cylindrotheca closterium TaxID=2856 RepID=A0AAD2FQK9_9STRA|nr:unnamed protein product [Cylindrotheca closterium]
MSEGKSYKDLLKLYIPGILAFLAAIFGTAGNLYCETVQFIQENNQDGGDPLVIYAGMWTFRTNENDSISARASDPLSSEQVCHPYQGLVAAGFDYDTDATTRFVMAFAILTPVIGGLALFLACAGPCCNVTTSRWRAMGGIFLLCGAFQGLTLVVMQSSICKDNPVLQYYEEYNPELLNTFPSSRECQGYMGYHLSIAAVALWILAGIAALVLPSPHVDGRQPQQTQSVTYQRDENGNVTETNVAIAKGTNSTPPEQAKPNFV